MLKLRPYKSCDAEKIVSWIRDERSFRQWSADRFDHYPLTAEELNQYYVDETYSDRFFEMTAEDESGITGHLIMRYPNGSKDILRFGFVIVDDTKRGQGYGKAMINLALKYAFEILKVDKVTIGVFENNPSAYHCYKSAGFHDVECDEFYSVMGEHWKCLELEAVRNET